jgi:ABC-type transport system involved in multi-copper enzyme maturation permease subunit
MASANFFNDDKIAGLLKATCFLLIWISGLAIAVATAARQIPAERENRTIFPLLAKPVTRAHVVAGKFLGCWLACGAALVVFYVFLAAVAASHEHELRLVSYFQVWWMQWMFLAVVISMVLLGSIIFAAPSSNATICVVAVGAILFLGRFLKGVSVQQPEPVRTLLVVTYYLIPHLEWYDLRHFVIFDKALVSWWAIAGATAYAWAYTAFFLLATWLCFRRKPLST